MAKPFIPEMAKRAEATIRAEATPPSTSLRLAPSILRERRSSPVISDSTRILPRVARLRASVSSAGASVSYTHLTLPTKRIV